jgi:DNA-binding response OmpR family regulator
LSSHPVVGRVPWLLILDAHRVHSAPRLPCSDFLVRGFTAEEALARCERLLAHKPERERLVRAGPVSIDLRGHEARLHDVPLRLPNQEFALLRHLVQHPGRVFSREALLSAVWGPDYLGGTRTVDIHVRRVRAKLGTAANHLETLRSVGYRWVA